MQAYSDPEREDDAYSLPDVEVFFMFAAEFFDAEQDSWAADAVKDRDTDGDNKMTVCDALEGFYWWSCFPGCLPDSDPIGPFETEQEALEDAQD